MSFSGPSSGRALQRVLILGDSNIVWAQKRATDSGIGLHLGLESIAKIDWIGKCDMEWNQLLPALFHWLKGRPPPQVLLIHVGEIDLGRVPRTFLSVKAKEDIGLISARVPGIRVAWSEILQKQLCDRTERPKRLDKARRKANKDLERFLESGGGFFIPHPRIKFFLPSLYEEDGVRLSSEGCDLFLGQLQESLRKIILGKEGHGSTPGVSLPKAGSKQERDGK